jgi:hypothetical protein
LGKGKGTVAEVAKGQRKRPNGATRANAAKRASKLREQQEE